MSVFFEGFQPKNVLIVLLFSMKHSYLLDALVPATGKNHKITPDERATAGESLHVRQIFSLNSKFLIFVFHSAKNSDQITFSDRKVLLRFCCAKLYSALKFLIVSQKFD